MEPPKKDNLADRGKFIVQFYILKTLSVFVNAFINAVILITRSSGVQGFFYRVKNGQLTIETFTHPERSRRSTAIPERSRISTAAVLSGLQQRNLQLEELQNKYANDNRHGPTVIQNQASYNPYNDSDGCTDSVLYSDEESLESVARVSNHRSVHRKDGQMPRPALKKRITFLDLHAKYKVRQDLPILKQVHTVSKATNC